MSGAGDAETPLVFSMERRALLERLLREEGAAADALAPIRPCGHPGPYLMSFAQQRLWFLDRLSPGNPFYNVQLAIRHNGPLDPAALERAFAAVVDRHAVLRTVFALVDGTPMQVVQPTLRIPLDDADLRGLPASEREAEAIRIGLEERMRPYDLATGPLGRIKLLRLAERDHVILLGLHHVVADGWSMGVLARELGALYSGSVLPLLPVQYADYAVWQRGELSGERLESELGWWRGVLASLPVLGLPLDFPRPAVQAHRGASLEVGLPAGLVSRLGVVARECRATLFMVVLAAYGLVLARWAGQEEVVVGAPVAGRERPELEGLIGFFVNTVVLRLGLGGDPSFAELVGRAREVALGAFAHAQLPFERLVEELAPERDLSRNPLFQVTLQLFDSPAAPELVQTQPGLELPVTSSLFDLRLDLWPAGEALAGRLEYDTDLFERASVSWFWERLRYVLEQVADRPGRPLSELSLLPPEQALLLAAWNDTAAPLSTETVVERVEEQARLSPERPAVADPDGRWSYRELNAHANRLAHRLQAAGVGAGDIVAVCLPRSRAFAACALAALKTGAAYLPLDAAVPAARLERLLQDAEPDVLLTGAAAPAAPQATRVIEVDPWPKGAEHNPGVELSADDPAYLIYTSGSTGAPKGVLCTHHGLANLVDWHLDAYQVTARDRGSMVASFGFDAAVWELWPNLCAGASLAVCDEDTRIDAHQLLRWLTKEKVSIAFIPTPLCDVLLQTAWPQHSPLRLLLTGGDRLSRHANPDHPYQLVNHYGPTENTVVATATPIPPAATGKRPPSIGAPIRNTHCYIVDPDGHLQGPGCPGELWLAGHSLAHGYHHDPHLTSHRFPENPHAPGRTYKTGDLVRWQPDGTLAFLGRNDDQIKIRGYRIEPQEIETLLSQHPNITHAHITTTQNHTNTPQLTAYIVPATGRRSDRQHQLEHWHTLYEQTYGEGEAADPEFDIRGWNSSYDGEPLGDDVMREQVEQTVERIAACRPRRLLEIGCGTGLLLFRLAPLVERYCATDFAATALARVHARVDASGWRNVELHECAADDFADLGDSEFDVVVLNSVVQYFPDGDYLERVLAGALERLAPGGTVFVGDVRNLALLETFHASVELAAAPAELAVSDLRRRIRRGVEAEQELVLDPGWFTRFARRQNRPIRVAAEPRRGRHLNELTRFRYDVTLTVDAPPARTPDRSVKWDDLGSVEALTRLLAERDGTVAVTAIPSARLDDCLQVQRSLEAAADGDTVGAVRGERAGDDGGIDPETLWTLPAARAISLGWHGSGETGRYDLLVGSDAVLPPPPVRDGPLCNNPLRHDRARVAELRSWLQERLPEQMVPTAIVAIEAIPLTPNGKVDVAALPPPDGVRAEPLPDDEPASETEGRLAALWAEALGLEQVGVHENFFELGGDSILTIKLAARAADAGLHFSTKQLFQNQTVAELARVVSTTSLVEAEQQPVVGRVPLTPIQHWFLEQDVADAHHFNQSALLAVPRTVNVNLLVRALHAVVRHHDALHLRFTRSPSGEWEQWSAPPEHELPVASANLSGVPPESRADALERAAEKIQASLSLGGPLVRVALFDLGPREPRRLLVVVHHLAVDGVSWGILVEDLWRAYGQLAQGQPASLPRKTTSFRQWAEALVRHAGEPELAEQAEFWLSQLPEEPMRLPRDLPGDDNRVAVTRSVRVELGLDETEDLLRRVLAEHGVQVNDVLLWALGRAVCGWTGRREVSLAMEAHGRETLGDEVDLTRTVGWFTAIFPLLLHVDEDAGPAAVAEQLCRVRDGGIGYGLLRHLGADSDLRGKLAAADRWPEISFNYLGRLDAVTDPIRERTGSVRGPAGTRQHLLEVNGAVTGGQLQFDFYFSTAIHAEATIDALAGAFAAELRSLLATDERSPSDVAVGDVSERDLETVLARLARDSGASS